MFHMRSSLCLLLSITTVTGCEEASPTNETAPKPTTENMSSAEPVTESQAASEPIPEVLTEGLDKPGMHARRMAEFVDKHAAIGRDRIFLLQFSTLPTKEALKQIYASVADRQDSLALPLFEKYRLMCAMEITMDEMVPRITYGKVFGIDHNNHVLHIELKPELQATREEFRSRPIEQWHDWGPVIAQGGYEQCVLILCENGKENDTRISRVRSDILESLDRDRTQRPLKPPMYILGSYSGNVAELSQKIESAEVISVDEDRREIRVKLPE